MAYKPGVSGNVDGRPKKSSIWKDAEDEIRECLPRLLRMPESLAQKAISKENDPTLAMKLCYTYITKFPCQAIERFLPDAWANDPNLKKEIADSIKMLVAEASKSKTLGNGHSANA